MAKLLGAVTAHLWRQIKTLFKAGANAPVEATRNNHDLVDFSNAGGGSEESVLFELRAPLGSGGSDLVFGLNTFDDSSGANGDSVWSLQVYVNKVAAPTQPVNATLVGHNGGTIVKGNITLLASQYTAGDLIGCELKRESADVADTTTHNVGLQAVEMSTALA